MHHHLVLVVAINLILSVRAPARKVRRVESLGRVEQIHSPVDAERLPLQTRLLFRHSLLACRMHQ